MTAAEIDRLADLLTGYRKREGRVLWGIAYAAVDAWELVVRPTLKQAGFDYLAVRTACGAVLVVSDCPAYSKLQPLAYELPTAAPGVIKRMEAAYGAAAFELSARWGEQVRGGVGGRAEGQAERQTDTRFWGGPPPSRN